MLGGDKRDRTADLLHAMQALSQLSYTPVISLKRYKTLKTIQDFSLFLYGEASSGLDNLGKPCYRLILTHNQQDRINGWRLCSGK